jgi:fibrillarin-like rRNA methylase
MQLFTEKNSKSKLSEKYLARWNPYTSKLAAALFSGMEIFPIKLASKIFYFDDYSTITLEHISNIINNEGIVYFLKNIENKQILNFTNVKIINCDIDNHDYFIELQKKIDVAYLDLSTDEKLNSIIKNCKIILKQNGFLVLVLNDKYSISDEFIVQIQNTIINLKESFELIQEINLSYFFKNSFMIVMKNAK